MISIVNYSVGNSVSVFNALKRAGIDSLISSDANTLAKAQKLILPGIGAFDYVITHLKKSGLAEILTKKVITENTPCLGICLGMQLMTSLSEEGHESGLGWLKAKTLKLNSDEETVKIPHIGWKAIEKTKSSRLLNGLYAGAMFYFSHSFHVKCDNDGDIAGITTYHSAFASVIETGHIAAVQFHPEKSHGNGLKLLRNFAENF